MLLQQGVFEWQTWCLTCMGPFVFLEQDTSGIQILEYLFKLQKLSSLYIQQMSVIYHTCTAVGLVHTIWESRHRLEAFTTLTLIVDTCCSHSHHQCNSLRHHITYYNNKTDKQGQHHYDMLLLTWKIMV